MNLLAGNRHPNKNFGNIVTGWGQKTQDRDDEFLNKICDYFISRCNETLSDNSNIWDDIVIHHQQFINLVTQRDLNGLHDMLSEVFKSSLTIGISGGETSFQNTMLSDSAARDNWAFTIFDKLLSLAEYAGIIEIFWLEVYMYNQYYDNYLKNKPEVFLAALSEKYQFDISSPKNVGGQFGISTDYGIYSERDVLALGTAFRIFELYKNNRDINICEIGGGAGHLAYYLYKMGFKNISIVDLPTVSVLQMYFLGMNIGQDKIKHLAPSEFTGKYDLVINCDSMPEMNINTATNYCNIIRDNAKYFISVNTEHATHRTFWVNQICDMERVNRNLFMFRQGYVIEEWKPRNE